MAMMVSLFSALSDEFRTGLEQFENVLQTAAPLKRAHKKELPHAIRELSELLTIHRADMSIPYWANPRLFSAYLHYFLPWNLVRLGHLLPRIELNKAALTEHPLVLDMGSGPLTLPLALWMARPDLRDIPLTILATDNAPQPLQAGKEIFQALTKGQSPWTIRTIRAQVPSALREARAPVGLLCGANVLNELTPRRDETLEERFLGLMEAADRTVADNGQVLLIEPGTRLGGRCISVCRTAALESGFTPISPCPHAEDCPMLAPRATSWCHFSMMLGKRSAVPQWLSQLSKWADLEKSTASLSFLHLCREGQIVEPQQSPCGRILSAPINLPGRAPGRYACTEQGLALVENAETLHSGMLVPLSWPEQPQKDAKSGAWIVQSPARTNRTPYESRPTGQVQKTGSRPERPSTGKTEKPGERGKKFEPKQTRPAIRKKKV